MAFKFQSSDLLGLCWSQGFGLRVWVLNPEKCEEADGHGVCIEEEDLIGVSRFRLIPATATTTTIVTAAQRHTQPPSVPQVSSKQ